jgi:hypothetical protein
MTPACMAALGSKLPENESALSVQQAVNRFPWLTALVMTAAGCLLFACGFRSKAESVPEVIP